MNTPLISCAAQIYEQQQIICKKLYQCRYCLIIWHVSGHLGAGLQELYRKYKSIFFDYFPSCRLQNMSAPRKAHTHFTMRVSHMKTLNMFYLVIYCTQKVRNDFIFLCSIILPPVGHSSNHEYHC